MGTLGPMELVLIFLAILLIFGAKRIPEIARGMGKGIREFKAATKDITNEFNVDDSSSQRIQPPRPPAQAPTPRDSAQPSQSSGTQDQA